MIVRLIEEETEDSSACRRFFTVLALNLTRLACVTGQLINMFRHSGMTAPVLDYGVCSQTKSPLRTTVRIRHREFTPTRCIVVGVVFMQFWLMGRDHMNSSIIWRATWLAAITFRTRAGSTSISRPNDSSAAKKPTNC